ncbi:MAG: hypothetical protein IJ224_10240 [Lachnospiraceae bacterium]|nr:hypothetical protein [Lachnospiraceae bacterium]
MKKLLFNNIGYKLLAIILAVLLWLVVVNITDYTVTVKIEDIPVEQLNSDALEELDQIYDVVKGDTVDIYVKGRRSVVSNLNAKNFYAYADLSQMSITNSVQINVVARNKNIEDEIDIEYVDNIMQLSLEDKVTEQFPVKVKTDGEPANNYAVGESFATPNIITIEGPKSAVEKITDVVVEVSINGARESITATGTILLLDAYGEQIKNDKIVLSQTEADVNVNIYPIKTIDVIVNIKGTPADGYGISEIVYQPQSVDIAGDEDVIKNVESIEINDISVSGLDESLQTTVNLNEYIPDGVVVAQSNPEIAITVDIEKLTSKKINISSTDITFTGKKSNYDYDIETTDNIIVEVSGLENIISELDVDAISPKVDCSDLTIGSHIMEIEFKEIDGVKYSVTGVVTVTVQNKNTEE